VNLRTDFNDSQLACCVTVQGNLIFYPHLLLGHLNPHVEDMFLRLSMSLLILRQKYHSG